MIWWVIGALLLNMYAALSRAALRGFSLADAEELLRKRDRIRSVLPILERFAEDLEHHAATFLHLGQLAKAVLAIALWHLLGEQAISHQILAMVIAFPLLLLAGDTLMRPIGFAFPEHLTILLHRVWRATHLVFWLPLAPFHLIHFGMERLLRREVEEPSEQAEDDIMAVVSLSEAKGQIDEHERDMIESVLGLGDLTADSIMTPRTDMKAISIDLTVGEAMVEASQCGHSRLPVYRENRDNIVGILYVKDLLGRQPDEDTSLEDIIREPLLVPSSKQVAEILDDLRRDRIHLAVVLDEYGGTAGILTFEDIIEEVFGEIEDEYDEVREVDAKQIGEEALELDARLKVQEVNERFELNLPESEHYESLGGLLTSMLGCIPETGQEWLSEDGVYCLTVLEATDRRVDRLRLERRDPASNGDREI